MGKLIFGLFLGIFLLCNSTVGITGSLKDKIPGAYEAISLPEWELTIELKKNGNAIIKDFSEKYSGTWHNKDKKVYITYNGITEELIYSESLSLSELGKSGGIPGLKGQASS